MASNAEVRTHQDRTIEVLERTITRSIRDHLRTSGSARVDPGELSDTIFGEVASRVQVIYGTTTDEATRKNYHRHWVASLGKLVSTGQVELAGLFFLKPGRHLRPAA